MRSTVIIRKRGDGYVSDVAGRFGGGHKGARAGLSVDEAAITAARLMVQYAQSNPDGGDLVAPDDIIARVPQHLRSIEGRTNDQ